ncbi:MAG TPA: NAD-dependent epimerase/dehydratase family protein, partial [Gemmatimonadaceae bacterium]|nr:NAD-dependent epimerase/dehydratase family protein [Gemmatimonadaceae bacterium]
ESELARRVVIDREAAERSGSFGRQIADLQPEVVIDLICFDRDSAAHLVAALRDRVEHFIHCGTLWVHGVPRSRPYDETAPREPFGDYGIRKAEIEKFLLTESNDGFPATVLHPGHITGPGWNPINPAGNLDMTVFDDLARGRTVTLPDHGLATLQHVHADDVAQAFGLAIDQPSKAIGESFHVASREPVTMRSYSESVAGWFGRKANLAFLPWDEWKAKVSERDAALTRDHMLHSPCASIEKARRVLGFEPRYTAVEAVRDALATQLQGIV